MSSLILVLVGLAMMAAGYLLYSKFLGNRVYQLSDAYTTPAHTMEDGVDFVPTNKYVLWGHHFTSVAGGSRSAPCSSRGCTTWVRCGRRKGIADSRSAHCPAATSARAGATCSSW